MKAFGIYILTDRTIRILLEFARNSELNEIAYREVLDDEKRKQGLPVHHPDTPTFWEWQKESPLS